jgi:hypothetical protein
MAEEEEVFDGFVEQDPFFDPTPVFGFDNGSLVINAPIQNELLTTFGNIDLIIQSMQAEALCLKNCTK